MRSDVVKKGIPAAPNRSLLYALGYTKEELERPATPRRSWSGLSSAWYAPITRSSPAT